MATRTLLATTCTVQTNGSYGQQSTYYDPDLRAALQSPLVSETTFTFTCTPYQIAVGVQLDQYCAVDGNGDNVLRTVYSAAGSAGVLQLYSFVDVQSNLCNGSCDLAITYQQATPTSAPNASDGHLLIEASSSHPPIDLYIAGLATPTPTRFNPGQLPAAYQWDFSNVAAGTYAALLQDTGNCQKSTNPLTVAKGSAPGTGTSMGFPSNIDWFKYEYKRSTTNNGGDDGTISGYAWDKTTKQGYFVPPTRLNYPAFNNRRDYAAGDIVSFIRGGEDLRVYYRAPQVLLQSDPRFASDNYRIPNPEQPNVDLGYWEPLNRQYDNSLQFLYKGALIQKLYNDFYQKKTSYQNGDYHYFYPKDTVVRYDWAGFYRAKYDLESNLFPNVTIPPPTVGASNNEWEKVSGYDHFYYAAAETDIIDQYSVGTLNRTVRFHVFNPEQPNYVPTTVDWVKNTDSDYILFDDYTPVVEATLGELKVIDIIKNDIDVPGAENGSVWILTESPSQPVRYHLRNGVRPGYAQDNTTGIYENLSAGSYVVDIFDSFQPTSRYVSAEFTIEDNYRPRWRLAFDDQRSAPLEIRVFERDWAGGVTDVTGTDEPVMHYWDDGDANGKSQAESVGAGLDFNVYTSIAQEFVDTATKDDRSHRVDYYRNGKLEFRGYINPSLYQEALLGPGQRVTLTATDGLAQLSDTKWVNHLRERQDARTNMLSVVLKCLSFCDVNLPVWCGLNLRDRLMSASGDPLTEAYIHRNAFNKKDGKVVAEEDIIDCRTVLTGVLRGFNAYLVQAAGCWKIVSLSEVHDDYEVRVWSPAGVLQTGVDTTPTPIHVLPPDQATGPNEMFWVYAGQKRTTTPAAIYAKATVGLQLEETLLRNGDFVDWDPTNTRPLYWTVQGTTAITRAKGEKAKEYAVRFANYTTTFNPSGGLLSPSAPHLPGQDEDSMVLKFKATLEGTTTNSAELKATLFFQLVCDGVNYGAPLKAELSTKDKWKEHTIYLPTGLPGTSVRVRVLPPVAADTASASTTLRLNNLSLAIQPGLLDWSDTKTDFFVASNLVAQTGVVLDDVELVLADLPLLPGDKGAALPPKRMDVYAWRHAISLQDYTATTAWTRPGYPAGMPLLDNAAQDRMAMYQVPATVLSGELKGPGINVIRAGQMLDAPQDVEGKFIILTCLINERKGTARITARKLADGYFDGAVPTLPNGGRVAYKRGKKGYRLAFVNGIPGYRIAHK